MDGLEGLGTLIHVVTFLWACSADPAQKNSIDFWDIGLEALLEPIFQGCDLLVKSGLFLCLCLAEAGLSIAKHLQQVQEVTDLDKMVSPILRAQLDLTHGGECIPKFGQVNVCELSFIVLLHCTQNLCPKKPAVSCLETKTMT